MKHHAQVLKKNGRKEFVVLPYDEYQEMCERLENAEDFALLKQAMKEDDPSQPGMSLSELKQHLGLTKRPKNNRSRRKTTS